MFNAIVAVRRRMHPSCNLRDGISFAEDDAATTSLLKMNAGLKLKLVTEKIFRTACQSQPHRDSRRDGGGRDTY
jgi:hypothetical protein